jgi:hypothetical protein
MTARQHSFVPISIDQGHVLLATTRPIIPDLADEIRMTFGLPVRCVICTPAELNAAIAEYYPRDSSRVIKVEQVKTSPSEAMKPKIKKPTPVKPMSDEEIRDTFWKLVVAFNFSLAFVCLGLNYLQLPRGTYNTWYQIPTTILLGAIAGGIVVFITWHVLRRLNQQQTQD